VHQGERPDISRADFTWCMLAIDWGHGIEETAGTGEREARHLAGNGRAPVQCFRRQRWSWLIQQAQYDLAHVHADRMKLKRLELV
jgi:hypothetical protein